MDSDHEHESAEVCWICLGDSGDSEELMYPCRCPRAVHPRCLARWQLHSAGKSEESACRFCGQALPDWRPVLTPANLNLTIPVVSVHYNGMCYRLRVKPGPEGLEHFRRSLQKITGMPALEAMQITFQCRSPDSAQELSFKGLSAFEAAIHCASVSAAARQEISRSGAQLHSTHTLPRCSSPPVQRATSPVGSGRNHSEQDIFEEAMAPRTQTVTSSTLSRVAAVPYRRWTWEPEQQQQQPQLRQRSAAAAGWRTLFTRFFS